MALRVVELASEIAPDGSRGNIVVESSLSGPPFSKAFDELESRDATNIALAWAASKGVTPANMNGFVSAPYPVTAAGLSLEQVKGPGGESLPQAHELMQPAHYRISVPVIKPAR